MWYDVSQPMFWYRPLFMAEIIIAEWFFAARLIKRDGFWWRALLGAAICFCTAFAFPLPPTVAYTSWYSSVMFLSLFGVSIAVMRMMYKGSFNEVLFCAIAGYTVQHIAQEIYEMSNVGLGLNGKLTSDFYGSATGALGGMTWFVMLIYSGLFIICYAAFFIFFTFRKSASEIKIKNSYMVIVSLVIVLIDVIISAAVTYTVPEGTNTTAVVFTHLYNIICCALVLFLLFELPRRLNAESELEAVRRIHHREKQQYFSVKENIDLINLKCHDLKHQIREIATRNSGSSAIEEIENVISVYDGTFKTDNDALDVILTEKSLLCHHSAIRLSCIADGARLDFMKDTDIYSLFGNMLDNAIESVQKLDADERNISVSVRARNSFLIINVRNAYRGKIEFKDGLPVTDKQNKDYHGFGMRSIRTVVDKYRGEMKINADGNVFNVNIVFQIN